MIKFPSIVQFRNVIRAVKQRGTYSGKDADGNPTYNRKSLEPKLNFFGTVKLHGTNASIVQEIANGPISFQSKERVITETEDNAGFANAQVLKYTAIEGVFTEAREALGVPPNTPLTIYGEWCGGNIQKNMAISGMDKMFVVFAIRIGRPEQLDDMGTVVIPSTSVWIRPGSEDFRFIAMDTSISGWRFITEFPTFCVNVDFAEPEIAQNEFVKLTLEVEDECPVGKALGVSGMGEGIVWSCTDSAFQSSDFVFKTKGEKHSASKVVTIAAVDVEKLNALKEVVAAVMTDNRMSQMLETTIADATNTKEFVNKCLQDAVKEETDTIVDNGFTIKEFSKMAIPVIRKFFFSKCDQDAFGCWVK